MAKQIERLGLGYTYFRLALLMMAVLIFSIVLAELDRVSHFTSLLLGDNPLIGVTIIAFPIIIRLLEMPRMISFVQSNKESIHKAKVDDEYDRKFLRLEIGRLLLLSLASSIGLLLLAGQSWAYFIFVFPALFLFDLLTIYCLLILIKLVLTILIGTYSNSKPESNEPQDSKPKRGKKT